MTFSAVSVPSSASQSINWGILGTGVIAHRFAADFVHVTDARLVGIGSRSGEKARAFGNRFRIPRQHGSYRELADDFPACRVTA
jgi:predicted dehydrogenase